MYVECSAAYARVAAWGKIACLGCHFLCRGGRWLRRWGIGMQRCECGRSLEEKSGGARPGVCGDSTVGKLFSRYRPRDEGPRTYICRVHINIEDT